MQTQIKLTKQMSHEIIGSPLSEHLLAAPTDHDPLIKPGHIRIQAEFDQKDLTRQMLNDTTLTKSEKFRIISQNKKDVFRGMLIELGINPKQLPDSVSNINLRDNIMGIFSHFEIDCTPEMMNRISELSMITSVRDITGIVQRLHNLRTK